MIISLSETIGFYKFSYKNFIYFIKIETKTNIAMMRVKLSMKNMFNSMFGRRKVKLVMVGLDASGKSTILYKFITGETQNLIPTTGFNYEEVNFGNLCFNIWDVASQYKIIALWKHYLIDADALIFVVDISNMERMKNAKIELFKLLESEESRDMPLLVFANKIDLGINNEQVVIKELKLNTINERKWFCIGTSAKNGSGIQEGFDWLAKNLKRK